MKKQTKIFCMLFAVLMILMQVAVMGVAAAERDDLTIAIYASPSTLDPYGTTDMPSGKVADNIFERLVRIDENNEVVPSLAESWEIIDDTTYRFKIREGVKFHDGTELTVNDVAFSFKKNSESPHAVTVNTNIDFPNCKIIDDHTYEVKLKKPFGPILRYLAATVMSIVPEKAYTELGADFGIKPVGTGAYEVVNWYPDDRIELTRFDDYWGEKANIKNITVRFITESTTRAIEMETNGVDIAEKLVASDAARLAQDPNITVEQQETYSTNFIYLTTTQPPLDNVKVRQAINYAINKESIVKVAYQGMGTVGRAPMSPTLFGYNDSLPQYTHDVEKAKQLLAEAGYPNGFEITIYHNEDQIRADICEMVQAQLAEVNINVKIQSLEWGALIERIYEGSMQMFVMGWSANSGDPDVALYSSFHTENAGAGGNMAFYSNPEVDALLEEGRVLSDQEKRKEVYMKAQEIIWKDCPVVALQHDAEATAYNKNLKGVHCTPRGLLDFSKISW